MKNFFHVRWHFRIKVPWYQHEPGGAEPEVDFVNLPIPVISATETAACHKAAVEIRKLVESR